MPQATQLTPEDRFFGLFIGRSGSGKTVAEASFPKPMEIWDFDGRIRGILGAPWINRERISYESFPPREKGLLGKINQKMELIELAGNVNQILPQTLVIDSVTSAAFAMIYQSILITHAPDERGKAKGTHIGPLKLTDPGDYKTESQGIKQMVAFLRSVKIPNIIISAHLIPKWRKLDPSNPYSESIQDGEKLSITDRLGEDVLIYFDHIFRFERREGQNQDNFTVKFHTDIARTAYTELPYGEVDITGKNFYETMMSYIQKPQLIQTAS